MSYKPNSNYDAKYRKNTVFNVGRLDAPSTERQQRSKEAYYGVTPIPDLLSNEKIVQDYNLKTVGRHQVPDYITNEELMSPFEDAPIRPISMNMQDVRNTFANLRSGNHAPLQFEVANNNLVGQTDPRGGLSAQELINRAYRMGGGTFEGAARVLKEQGLDINGLVRERDIERGTPNRVYIKAKSTPASPAPIEFIRRSRAMFEHQNRVL